MTALLLITVLCTALALLARRFGWACTAGMAAGGVMVLTALVCSIPTQTLLLCLLIPCIVVLPPFAAPRTLGTAACGQPWVLRARQSEGPAAAGVYYAGHLRRSAGHRPL